MVWLADNISVAPQHSQSVMPIRRQYPKTKHPAEAGCFVID